jgi:hypothetical protein
LGEKFVVGALFNDLASLDNADAVGVADGAEAVGDDNQTLSRQRRLLERSEAGQTIDGVV